MERGGVGFHRYRKHAKQSSASSSASGIALALQPNSSSANGNGIVNNNVPNNAASNANDSNPSGVQALPPLKPQSGQSFVREQDQYMPIANVIRIMRRILPAHAKISDDAKETIQECVSEYISFVTGEANERCQREQRKTITAEDVLWAMGKLGFDDYVEPLTLFLNRYRENENERTTLQNPILKRSAADFGAPPMPPYMPGFPMGDPQAMYDGAMIGGYYRDPSAAASAGSSSHNHQPMTSFDPFAHFK